MEPYQQDAELLPVNTPVLSALARAGRGSGTSPSPAQRLFYVTACRVPRVCQARIWEAWEVLRCRAVFS